MTDSGSFMQRHSFAISRLHSLAGLFPIGAFLIMHLTTNASIMWGRLTEHGGAGAFQHEVDFIHSLPALLLIEIFGLWIPIAFHAILGIYYAKSGRPNVRLYNYEDNWRYTLQRVSGYIGVIFIFYHVATLRWGWDWLPFASMFNAEQAATTTALALRGGAENPASLAGVLVALFYLLGVGMLVYHFANGLWTAAITWGLTITEKAQRRWGIVCAGVGFALMAAGVSAIVGFVSLDLESSRIDDALRANQPSSLIESSQGEPESISSADFDVDTDADDATGP